MANKQGVMDRVSAWNQSRIAKQKQRGPYATVAAGAKDAFTVFVGGFVPFGILIILTISAGFYFNGLRGFSGDVRSVVAYGTAAFVEAGNLALFFVSSKAFWSGKTGHFVMAMLLGLALSAISVVAQVLYLSNNIDAASIGEGANLLAGLPLVGSLASTATIIVTRALALHVVELACCYVIARSSVSHKKVMQQQIEEQSERMLVQIGEQFISFMEARMKGNAIAASDRPALPPAKEGVLDLPKLEPAESEGASNGNGTFHQP